MKNSQKGFIVPLVITLVALVIGGGAYVYIKNMQVSQTSIAENTQDTNLAPTVATSTLAQTDETAGWETYINNKYGFEFRYPSHTAVVDSFGGVSVANWEVFVFGNPQKLNFEDWFKSRFNQNSNKSCEFLSSNFSVGNYRSYLVSTSSFGVSCDDSGYYAVNEDNSKVVKFAFGHDPLPEGKLDQILSTFKFIPSTQATSTSTQSAVNRGDAVFHITESPDDGYDSQFADSFHIDLFSNNLLVYSVDSQQSENGVSFATIKDFPFGEYTIHLKAVGYKKLIDTITFNDKEDGFVFRAILGDSDRVGK